ncbi:hypothetical protein [Luteimonas deserti]|uniref:Uncharacterized protein n=1 Tax=Luteimonas deserti TaxID=2752306 RepID=A0A7Z0TZH0_9GAMM|nr:hypothetical protein [Luteimonas deserti]NYZ63427.1 hypothetical protein [Luteimonas deserti]
MDICTPHPRLYFDANSQLAERSYALVQGTLDDLAALGLDPAAACGLRFTFVQEELRESEELDALMFNGTISHSPSFGHFALADEGGALWLSEFRSRDA